MKIVGYKFQIICDNGDTCEWYREEHIESPIYTTKEAAESSVVLVKKRMLQDAKKEMTKYIQSQIDCEINNGRDVNKFLCRCQTSLMSEYRRIINEMKQAEIVAIYAKESPTEEYNEFNLAD